MGVSGARRIVARHGWWLLVTAIVTLAITVATGWFLFPVYGVANAAGSVLYLDRLGRRRARARRILFPVLTVLQLPVGLLAALLWPRARPVEAILSDEERQEDTAASNFMADRGRFMGGPV